MILNLRGTSGSGKSHLARAIMATYPEKLTVKIAGRKRPLGYIFSGKPDRPRLAVVGHYEAACGGCDTIPTYEQIYDLVRRSSDWGMNVLYEGLLISGESRRVIELREQGYDVNVIAIRLPIDEAVANVNRRRRIKDPDKPDVNPRNTIAKARAVEIAMEKMQAAGVNAQWMSYEDALSWSLTRL